MQEHEGAGVSKAFRGSISTDIRDSVPDWAPFEPPNVVDVSCDPYVDLEREAQAMLARK